MFDKFHFVITTKTKNLKGKKCYLMLRPQLFLFIIWNTHSVLSNIFVLEDFSLNFSSIQVERILGAFWKFKEIESFKVINSIGMIIWKMGKISLNLVFSSDVWKFSTSHLILISPYLLIWLHFFGFSKYP